MADCCKPLHTEKITGQKAAFSVALAGNPNCGKTTVFNALTGAKQRIGNWPGVTVERKSGLFTEADVNIEVIDLPGIYSLTLAKETGALDERIAFEFLLTEKPNVIINIIDASHLERHLYLTMQLLEMGAPVILALNMMDIAQAQNKHLNLQKLSRLLGCPIIALKAHTGSGIRELKKAIAAYTQTNRSSRLSPISYPEVINKAIRELAFIIRAKECAKHMPQSTGKTLQTVNESEWMAMRLLEDDVYARRLVSPEMLTALSAQKAAIRQVLHAEADILLADARYKTIRKIMQQCDYRMTHQPKHSMTSRIDSLVLNRFLGIPIFLGVMYLLFFFSINIGGAFQDFFDISSQTLFVDGLRHWLTQIGSPAWLTVLLANGAGKGINTTVTFIPIIGALFLFLAFLEDSGYMARAAFVIDRLMRALGLPGKAFVPMIVGFGCNVPAVMGARTLENPRDRILTIMMSPFMSCGARLAIYAVFTTAFFPRGGQNVVFVLYLIGILMAVLTGFILRKTVLKGELSPLIMELPLYHWPRGKTLWLHAWQRLKNFIFRAGKLIVPICVLLGALNSLNVNGSINTGGDTESLLSLIGQWVTPLFSPMGIHTDNWPATVGLVTGILAKEVVVGTLNTLYTQMGHLNAVSASLFSWKAGLASALHSIPANFRALGQAFSNPVLAMAPTDTLNQGAYGLMYQKFDGQRGAFAYLLFVLLYFPCVSTTAAMLRELHRGWSIFSICWMTGIAYGIAVLFYQAVTLASHPVSSSLWILGVISVFAGTFFGIRWYASMQGKIIISRHAVLEPQFKPGCGSQCFKCYYKR